MQSLFNWHLLAQENKGVCSLLSKGSLQGDFGIHDALWDMSAMSEANVVNCQQWRIHQVREKRKM